MDRPPRLIVHAGFHKTGTSSIQKTLRRGRKVLEPHLRIFLKPEMEALCAAARAHDAAPCALTLRLFAHEVAVLAEGLDPGDPRPALLSSEDLSGHIPGRRDRRGYPNAPALMQTLAQTLTQAWGRAPELTFVYTTRAPEAWMRSCHAQHLRVSRMTQELPRYIARQRDHADLEAIAGTIRAAVAPHPLRTFPLEITRDLPNGPLSPLLELAGVPEAARAALPALPPANAAAPAEVLAQFLALNRADLPRDELRARKQALIPRPSRG
ncbi:hypothetical protein KM176_12915 [Pseudooceanicola sp. CBS1P-1]|uniref:Sulfotransferase family protein n=1 Tax=Pseudooceanicola albus TaxID=2692189 RepID=A0A6L7G270_9RHOB|nr:MULTISPECIES: hypothetical protein [Pseudooceanicola]MBT9384763.1 hypothetical protein [Pseudooceanicola endophyticus]MXN18464.1 hypothetical protein [Pseudooceanicola albus]